MNGVYIKCMMGIYAVPSACIRHFFALHIASLFPIVNTFYFSLLNLQYFFIINLLWVLFCFVLVTLRTKNQNEFLVQANLLGNKNYEIWFWFLKITQASRQADRLHHLHLIHVCRQHSYLPAPCITVKHAVLQFFITLSLLINFCLRPVFILIYWIIQYVPSVYSVHPLENLFFTA